MRYETLQLILKHLISIYSDHSGLNPKEIDNFIFNERYLTTTECLQHMEEIKAD